ncbi:hypothetical protein BC940DRAFT_332659 [Gongronella butleri]|nr:hypothetical protein BC940DRAFT_332659 [Gongronella butleri]
MTILYCCTICQDDKDYLAPRHLQVHLHDVHDIDLPRRKIGIRTDRVPRNVRKYGCASCPRAFASPSAFHNHLIDDHHADIPRKLNPDNNEAQSSEMQVWSRAPQVQASPQPAAILAIDRQEEEILAIIREIRHDMVVVLLLLAMFSLLFLAPSPTDNQDLGCCSCTQTFPTLDVFRNHLVVDYGIVPPDAPDVQWTSQHYQKTYPLEVKLLMSYVTESDTAELPPSATETTTTSSTSADAPISLAQSARPMPPTPLVNQLQPEPRQIHGAVLLMIVGAILAPIFRYFRRQ